MATPVDGYRPLTASWRQSRFRPAPTRTLVAFRQMKNSRTPIRFVPMSMDHLRSAAGAIAFVVITRYACPRTGLHLRVY